MIEAGDLRRNAPLRAICERAKNAVGAALLRRRRARSRPADRRRDARGRARDLARRARRAGSAARRRPAGLAPRDPQARAVRARQAAGRARRRDGGGGRRLDAALDGLVDAAFAGRTGELEVQFGKARTAGTAPGTIVSAALRQVAQLHKARLAVEDGASVGEAAGGYPAIRSFQPQGRGRGGAENLDVAAARARDGAARRGHAGDAPASRRWPKRSRNARCCRWR